MNLICIDDVTDILNFGDGIKELTYGKEYHIRRFPQSERHSYVSIINDKGVINEYFRSRFVTREEYRDIKINKVIEKNK